MWNPVFIPQDQQSCPGKGVREERFSSWRDPGATSNHHWWNESGPEAERERPDLLAVGRISLVPCPSWTFQEPSYRCCLWRLQEDVHQRCRAIQQRDRHGNPVPEHYTWHKIQRWRKLLCSPANKTALIRFLVEQWKGPQQREKLQEKVLYVTCEQLCFRIAKEQCEEVSELRSSQEEADIRLLLHALHAADLCLLSLLRTQMS